MFCLTYSMLSKKAYCFEVFISSSEVLSGNFLHIAPLNLNLKNSILLPYLLPPWWYHGACFADIRCWLTLYWQGDGLACLVLSVLVIYSLDIVTSGIWGHSRQDNQCVVQCDGTTEGTKKRKTHTHKISSPPEEKHKEKSVHGWNLERLAWMSKKTQKKNL